MISELNMRVRIGKVAAICFLHLRRLRQLRFVLTSSSMQRLVSALIISRVGCCNSVLYGLSAVTLASLQRVLHAAVRLVANLGYRDHVTPVMKELHWLPIAYRIRYKLFLMMHAAVNNRKRHILPIHSSRHHLCFTVSGFVRTSPEVSKYPVFGPSLEEGPFPSQCLDSVGGVI